MAPNYGFGSVGGVVGDKSAFVQPPMNNAPPIISEIAKLHEAINDLEKVYSEYFNRLRQISVPRPANATSQSAPPEPLCEIAQSIHDARMKISLITHSAAEFMGTWEL